jgi:hypothetical protein
MMFTTFTKAVLAILAVFLTTASVVSAKDDYEVRTNPTSNHNRPKTALPYGTD